MRAWPYQVEAHDLPRGVSMCTRDERVVSLPRAEEMLASRVSPYLPPAPTTIYSRPHSLQSRVYRQFRGARSLEIEI